MESRSIRLALEESAAGRRIGIASRSLLARPLFLAVVDLSIVLIAYFSAWLIRISIPLPAVQQLLPNERWDVVTHPWIGLLLGQVFFLYIFGLYDDFRITRYREIVAFTFLACVLQTVTLTSIFYFTNSPFPRTVILIFGAVNCIGLCAWRFLVKAQSRWDLIRVLIVADAPEAARELVRDIQQGPWMGMEIVGLATVDKVPEAGEADGLGCPVLGSLEEIRDLVVAYEVEEIIFASQQSWKDRVLHSLSTLQRDTPLRIAILPSVYETVIGKLEHVNIHDTPLIQVRRNPREPVDRFVKRSFDVVFSAVLLVLLSPILLLVAILIRVFAPGPIFYCQERVGYRGQIFRLVKLRTMRPDAEEECGEVHAQMDDPRVTSIGRVLRRFRIDELPQLVNVLLGDMSFVGPRPERPSFVHVFNRDIPGYTEREKVKPGITGLAQVRAYYHTAVENKLKYDLAYIYNYSFSLDLIILLETVKVILTRRGS